jgi:hypothetical protein
MIHVFYHVAQINHWKLIVQEQLYSMYVSGLIDNIEALHVGVNGNEPIVGLPHNSHAVHHDPQYWKQETATLKMLKAFCDSNPGKKVLYINSLGASHTGEKSVNKNSWRLYLEYFDIHGWKQCVDDLNDHDCVGALWRQDCPYHHFCGNVWWANSDYIAKLSHAMLDDTTDYRFREFWIGSGTPKVKNYDENQNSLTFNFYDGQYPPSWYVRSKR